MADLKNAIEVAVTAHWGQRDRGGEPYILHPLYLMFEMNTDTEKIVAVLHDVVEDTDVSLDTLKVKGFSEEILGALDCLTRRDGESYENFIERIKQNVLACKVKLADLKHNMDISRIPNPGPKDWERVKKYQRAFQALI